MTGRRDHRGTQGPRAMPPPDTTPTGEWKEPDAWPAEQEASIRDHRGDPAPATPPPTVDPSGAGGGVVVTPTDADPADGDPGDWKGAGGD
jgi:hypothetical protein